MHIFRFTLFFLLVFFASELSAQLRINEVALNPAPDANDLQYQTISNCTSTSNGSEWIELFNESLCDTLDLTCYIIAGQYSSSNGASFAFPAGTKLAPLDFLIIAGPNVPEADFVPTAFCNADNYCSAGTWELPNDIGWIAIYDNNLEVVDAVFWTASAGQANTLVTNQAFAYSPCVPVQCQSSTNLKSAKDMTPGLEILYAGQAPANGGTIYRSSDGSGNWLSNGVPSIKDCNGTCIPPSDLKIIVERATNATCERNNGMAIVSASGGVPGYSFEWNNGSGYDTLRDLSAGVYTVTLTDDAGCSHYTSINIRNVGTALVASISPADTAILNGDSVRLDIVSNNTVYKAVWNPFIYLSCGLCTNPYSVPEESTEYVVQLEDANGCTATATAVVKVIPDENSVFVPTAFTPNEDNLNDVLFVRSPRLKSVSIEIYDRWGMKVFHSSDIAIGWDGNYSNGKEANEGVYIYVVDAEFANGKTRVFKGNVTLLR